MCVIMCYEDDFPKLETLKSAEDMNSDGGGMAWISKKDGFVHWKKGIKATEMMDLIEKKKIQLPIIIHFRIATVGGSGKELTHPFPIDEGVENKMKGKADSVLFHNGTWTDWRKTCLKTIIQQKVEFPRGYWSDSRALAWLTSRYGTGFLNLVTSSKIAVLTKNGIEKYSDGWTTVDGAICSNSHFERSFTYGSGNYNGYTGNDTTQTFNNYDDDEYNPYGYWVKGVWTAYTQSEKERIKKRREGKNAIEEKHEEKKTETIQLKISQQIDKEVEEAKKNRDEKNDLDVLSTVDEMIEKESMKGLSLEEFQNVFDGMNDKIIAEEYNESQENRRDLYLRNSLTSKDD